MVGALKVWDGSAWQTVSAQGASGVNGVGVPTGGTAGQSLVKRSATDFDAGWSAESWQAYTPTWRTSVGPIALGNSTLVGRYAKDGTRVAVRVILTVGSSWNGSVGPYWVGLPFPAAAGSNQQMLCDAYIAAFNYNYSGFAHVPASASECLPHLAAGPNTSAMYPIMNCDGSAQVSTGVPLVNGNYSYVAGSVIGVSGVYEST